MTEENNATVTAETEVVNTEGVTENTEKTEVEPVKKEGSEEFVPFPKKAQNALSRRDRTIGKLQAKLRDIETRYAELSQKNEHAQGKVEDKGPQEKDFETFAEYLEAKALWKVEQRISQQEKAATKANQEKETNAERERYINVRSQEIAKKTSEMVKTFPDLQGLIMEHKDLMDSLPPAIQDVFFEAEDPVLAFYNMAKTGTLGDLLDMTPTRAAMAVAMAQTPAQPKTTQAPKPMQGAKGTGTTNADANIGNNADAMRKWLKERKIS